MILTKLLTLTLAAFLGHTAPVSVAQGCSGCAGSGSSASASGGSCGSGYVSISVTVYSGRCKLFQTWDPPVLGCEAFRPCKPQVTRTWSGLAPGSALDFCVTIGDDTLCLEPQPSAGSSGGGSDSRDSAEMQCSDDPGDSRSFSVQAPGCGLSASVSATCSGCAGV